MVNYSKNIFFFFFQNQMPVKMKKEKEKEKAGPDKFYFQKIRSNFVTYSYRMSTGPKDQGNDEGINHEVKLFIN